MKLKIYNFCLDLRISKSDNQYKTIVKENNLPHCVKNEQLVHATLKTGIYPEKKVNVPPPFAGNADPAIVRKYSHPLSS